MLHKRTSKEEEPESYIPSPQGLGYSPRIPLSLTMISWVERGLLTSVGSQGERNAAIVGRGICTGLLEMETAIKNRP